MSNIKELPSQKELHENFEYVNGHLYWKIRKQSRQIGKPAGCLTKSGYVTIGLNKKKYLAHRLIFKYHHGFVPDCLDHIDGNPINNCIENLRVATLEQNQYNRKISEDNSSGFKGVYFHKPTQKWMSYIKINKKMVYLGVYADKSEAAHVSLQARIEYHGNFARTI